MEAAAATGAAHDATVVVANNVPALEAALAAAKEAAEKDQPVIHLAKAEAKVVRLRASLAAAEAEVERLRAVVEGNE